VSEFPLENGENGALYLTLENFVSDRTRGTETESRTVIAWLEQSNAKQKHKRRSGFREAVEDRWDSRSSIPMNRDRGELIEAEYMEKNEKQ